MLSVTLLAVGALLVDWTKPQLPIVVNTKAAAAQTTTFKLTSLFTAVMTLLLVSTGRHRAIRRRHGVIYNYNTTYVSRQHAKYF
jgi:hypothetical protein